MDFIYDLSKIVFGISYAALIWATKYHGYHAYFNIKKGGLIHI